MASPHLRLTDYAVCDVTVQRITSDSFDVVYLRPNQLVEGQWHALKPVRPEVRACSLRALFCEAVTWVWLWPHANFLAARFVTEINGQPFLDCAKDNVATLVVSTLDGPQGEEQDRCMDRSRRIGATLKAS